VNTPALKNWIPYKLVNDAGSITCKWLNTFSISYTDPFFEDSLVKINSARINFRFRSASDLQMINTWAAGLPAVEPKAIIFHISRCGSTLVSQLLATLPRHIVLSEVPLFDQILRLQVNHAGFDEQATSKLFTSALKFYGQNKTTDPQSDVFIKADCWHLFFYEQLRRLYPKIPFIIIYRSPDAVFRSHRKMPGLHTIPYLIEPALFGFEAGSGVFETLETYLAAVIESYLKKSLDIVSADNHTLLLNYNEGPMPILNQIAAFAGISLSAQELGDMAERSRYHSKKPQEHFSEEPVDSIPPVLYSAMDTYKTLDKKRLTSIGV